MAKSKLIQTCSLPTCLGFLLVPLLVLATACSSATPTRPPTPRSAVFPTAVPVVPTSATTQPTAAVVVPTLPSLPTAGSPTAVAPVATAVPVTPTLTVVRPTAKPSVASVQPTSARPVASGGKLAYSVVTEQAPRFHTIWVANVDGNNAGKVLDYAAWPAFSPNGKSLAFFELPGGGKNEGLYVSDAFGGNPVPAYINPGVCCIHWSRDGNWIVFTVSTKANQPGGPIMMIKADGFYKTVVDLKVVGNGPNFSPDGKQIAFSGCLPNTNTCGVMVAPADGTGVLRSVTRDNGGNAQWSPNGSKILYQAMDDASHNQVYVVNADGSGKKQLTKGKGNDGQPVWSRDGNSIFWRSDQNGTSWALYVMNADGSNPRRVISDVPPEPSLWGWESLSIAP